jgi:hypothetical protein
MHELAANKQSVTWCARRNSEELWREKRVRPQKLAHARTLTDTQRKRERLTDTQRKRERLTDTQRKRERTRRILIDAREISGAA